MKKAYKNVLLCFVVISIILTACTSKKNKAAVEYRDANGKLTASVSQGFASLWIGVQKDSAADYLAIIEADENGWDTILDEENGKTFGELYRNDCVLSLKNLLAVEYLHDYVYGIEFTDEQQKSVEKRMSKIASSFGSQKAFEQEMQKYGSSPEDYERYLCLMLKQTTLFNSFYGENGMRVIPEEKKKQYFEDKYSIVYHIYIDTRGTVKDDGTVVSLTEAEKQEKIRHADEIYSRIQKGEVSFEQAFLEYTEDAYASQKPNGYFVTRDGTYFTEFTDAAFSLAPGEITSVMSKAGVHIMKRYPMDASLYNTDEAVYSDITEKLISEDFSGLISTVIEGVSVNDEVVEQLDASLIKPFAGF